MVGVKSYKMIKECTKKNISNILHVINDASLKYKGIIPNNCWHEPYMLEKELVNEFDNGVRMFSYNKNNKLTYVETILKNNPDMINDPSIPKINKTCDKCNHTEVALIKYDDENLSYMYICMKPECKHYWINTN